MNPQIPDALKKLAQRWKSTGKTATPEELKAALPGLGGSQKPVAGVSRARVMPTVYKGGIIKVEWFRRFTWRERIAIALGANFLVYTGVACEHRCGKYQPLVMGKASKHSTPDAHMQEVIEGMLSDPKSPVHQMIPMEQPK